MIQSDSNINKEKWLNKNFSYLNINDDIFAVISKGYEISELISEYKNQNNKNLFYFLVETEGDFSPSMRTISCACFWDNASTLSLASLNFAVSAYSSE